MMSTGLIDIECANLAVSLSTHMIVPVYNERVNIIVMSQLPEYLPPPAISADILKGKLARCTTAHKNLQAVVEDSASESDQSGVEGEKGSNEEGSHPEED